MIKTKDITGLERDCDFVKMQVIINFLDDAGKNYETLYYIYGTDHFEGESLTNYYYVIDVFEDSEAAIEYFVKLKYAVDKSEGRIFTPENLPFPQVV